MIEVVRQFLRREHEVREELNLDLPRLGECLEGPPKLQKDAFNVCSPRLAYVARSRLRTSTMLRNAGGIPPFTEPV